MPILALFTGQTDKNEYEALRKVANWEGEHPPGGLFHTAAFDDSGTIYVADVWESAEALNAFVEERLMPAFEQLGLQPPDVAVYPAHNINAFPSLDAYRL